MNRQRFEHFLRFPGELSPREAEDLGALIHSFPYCHTLYMMLARAYSGDDSVYFQGHLRMAAARAIDRKRLKQLILDDPAASSPSEAVLQPAISVPSVTEPEQSDLGHFQELIAELEQTFLSLQIQKAKGRGPYDIEKEFAATKRHRAEGYFDGPGDPAEVPFERSPGEESNPLPSRSAFFDPADIARKSVIEHDDIATETLARIYAEQGHHQRAIKIYQQLILKFPEKSRYFAAQIKNLENKPGI